MEAKKVYESIAQLCNNIVNEEKLRYELTKDNNLKQLFISQINNMLFLEKEKNISYNNTEWATVFAKSLVKITKEKHRFEKPDKMTIDEIYKDYSELISYTTKTYEIGRNQLVDNKIKFTEQDVLFVSVLTDEIKSKYKQIEAEKQQNFNNENDLKKENNKKTKNDQSNQNNFNQNDNFNGFNQSGNFDQNAMFNQIPVHPMQDPRFYPYTSKPKWMRLAKIIAAILTFVTSMLLIILMSLIISFNIDIAGGEYANIYGGSTNWGDYWSDTTGNSSWNGKFHVLLSNASIASLIFSYLFFIIPTAYIAVAAFKKPRNAREKYKMGIWPVVFAMIFFGFAIFDFVGYLKSANVAQSYTKYVTDVYFSKGKTETNPPFNYNFDSLWQFIQEQNVDQFNYLNNLSTLSLIAIILLSVTVSYLIILLIVNPRLDRQKVMYANTEYQKAVGAMMSGQKYQMDPKLFEDIEPKKGKSNNKKDKK